MAGSKSNIELHLHLDGAANNKLAYEVAKMKSLLPSTKSQSEFDALMRPKEKSLTSFLEPFNILRNIFAGDKENIAKLCENFVDDCYIKSGLYYFEARYYPMTWSNEKLSSEESVKIILDALNRRCEHYGIKCRSILCMIRSIPETAKEVMELAEKYQCHGVGGIDVAGDDSVIKSDLDTEIEKAYKRATDLGLGKTIHAGENGDVKSIYEAIDKFKVSRIGHGYKIITSEEAISYARSNGIHFEACPTSSYETGSVIENYDHPVKIYAEKNLDFSISTDDPLIVNKWLLDELEFCEKKLGLTKSVLMRTKISAAKASFLPLNEKKDLIEYFMKASK